MRSNGVARGLLLPRNERPDSVLPCDRPFGSIGRSPLQPLPSRNSSMPAAGLHVASAERKTDHRMRRNGRGSAIGGSFAGTWIHFVVCKPCGLPQNQEVDPLRIDGSIEDSCCGHIEDAKAQGSRTESPSNGLPKLS